MGALMSFRVVRLAFRADERSITVIFQAKCMNLACRMSGALEFLANLDLSG